MYAKKRGILWKKYEIWYRRFLRQKNWFDPQHSNFWSIESKIAGFFKKISFIFLCVHFAILISSFNNSGITMPSRQVTMFWVTYCERYNRYFENWVSYVFFYAAAQIYCVGCHFTVNRPYWTQIWFQKFDRVTFVLATALFWII